MNQYDEIFANCSCKLVRANEEKKILPYYLLGTEGG